MKKIIDKFLFKYVQPDWNIGIGELGEDFDPKRVRWVKHSFSDRWFADPFLARQDDDYYYLFAEEFLRDEKKGRISELTVRKDDMVLISLRTVLATGTHLSFPISFVMGDCTYMYPENSASGKTCWYNLSKESYDWDVLLSKPVADPVIRKIQNIYYLFCTEGAQCNGNELVIYKSYSPLHGYEYHQTIRFDENIARRAGKMFFMEGTLISPAQVCNNDYGEAISLQSVEIVGDKFHIKEIKRIFPFSLSYPNGFHTYNVYKSLVVIDGYKYRCPRFRKLYYFIRK